MIFMDYDSRYSRDGSYWGDEPHELAVALAGYLREGARVLDLGCGEGQSAAYLARKGLSVTAVDISAVGIGKAAERADSLGTNVKTEVADIREYLERPGTFEAIMCLNVLQFVPADRIRRVIDRIRKKISPGGYAAVASFWTDDPERKKRLVKSGKYVFDPGELAGYFSDWEMIENREGWSGWETHGEPRHRHRIVRLIARKPLTG